MNSRRSAAAAPAAVAGCLLVLLAIGSGCGDDDSKNPTGPGSPSVTTVLTGIFAGAERGGLVSLSLSTADLAPALPRPERSPRPAASRADSVVSATMGLGPVGGGAINLAGTYDTMSDSLLVAGQGHTVRGRADLWAGLPVVAGLYSSATDSGGVVCTPGGSGTVKAFCGEFQSGSGSATGRWNLAVSGGTVVGLMAGQGGSAAVAFTGTVTGTGTIRSISVSGVGLTGTGSWNTSSDLVAGAWSMGGDTGPWDGQLCLPADDE